MSFWSFRPLLVFWAVVIGLVAGGVIGLQFLGPAPTVPDVSFPASRDTAIVQGTARPRAAAIPAHIPASTANPAPALPMTAASIPDPDPALLETAPDYPDRMLPRAAGGRTPGRLYAAAFDPAERHPRIALVIDGAGLDQAMTTRAIQSLPSAIDLAFSAYALPDVAGALARTARRQGRECLVSIPMEPSGFPAAEEGTRSLLTGADPAQNRVYLEWALSGVAGCVGATGGSDGLNGERFAESNQAFADLLETVSRRGLIYLDPRPGAAPLADTLAAGRMPPRIADVVVDHADTAGEPADAQTIDRNLAALTEIAARRGSAIGLAGPPRPVLLDRIAVWVNGLAARGIVLAPLSAIPTPAPAAQE